MKNKTILLLLAFLLLLALPSTAYTLKNPIIYYQLEANFTDNGTYQYNLTGINNPSFGTGKLGNAVDLEGTTPNRGVLQNKAADGSVLTTIRTIDFWIKPEDTRNDNSPLTLFASSTDWLMISLHANNLNIDLKTNNTARWNVNGGPIALGSWRHYILVMGAGGVKLYTNGSTTPIDTDPSVEVITSDFNNLTIGARWTNDYHFDGMVDNIAIFTDQYNTSDVTESWNGGAGTNFTMTSVGTSSVSGVSITNSPLLVNDTANCTHTFSNSTGGSGNFAGNISWFVNGAYVTDSVNLSSNGNFDVGDTVICQVWPYDGAVAGNSVNSTSKTVFLFDTATQGYNTGAIHNSQQNYNITLNFSTSAVKAVRNVTFSYNFTNYTSTSYSLNTTHLFMNINNFLLPTLTSSLALNFTWYFEAETWGANTTFNYSSTQTVYPFGLDNCSSYGNRSVNFTTIDSTTDKFINASISGWLNVTWPGINGSENFNLTWSGTATGNHSICISPAFANATTNAQFLFSAFNNVSYASKTYYFRNFVLDNKTELINLYLTQNTTIVTFTVLDLNDVPVPGAIIKVQTYDFETNTYKTTEILSTDGDGQALGNIVLSTVWYSFIIEVDGEVKLQTTPTKITGTSRTFRISLVDDYFVNYNDIAGVSHNLTWTNSTTTFRMVYSDPTGGVARGCLTVDRKNVQGSVRICDNCETSSAATILCNINVSSGDFTYLAVSKVFIDSEEFILDTLSVNFNVFYRSFGLSGLVYSFLIILFLVLAGMWLPEVSVALGVIGLIVMNVAGFARFNYEIIITIIIIGGITLYKMAKDQ